MPHTPGHVSAKGCWISSTHHDCFNLIRPELGPDCLFRDDRKSLNGEPVTSVLYNSSEAAVRVASDRALIGSHHSVALMGDLSEQLLWIQLFHSKC